MITLIIKSYLFTMLVVLAGSIILFITGLTYIFKSNQKNKKMPVKIVAKEKVEKGSLKKPLTITSNDISAIAGDDMIATQLDLARAYIETGKVQLAKKILSHAQQKGSSAQQQEAKVLLGLL
jgi:FimV-like protein